MAGIFDSGIFDSGIFDMEAGAPPVVEESGGHGRGTAYWRTVRKNRANRLKELYERLREEEPSPFVVAEVAAEVAPYVDRVVPAFTLPAPSAVDWKAIADDAAAKMLVALQEAIRLAQEQDDEDVLLLMAA